MTESLKFIVNNVNDLLGTEYNMISFDSLAPVALMQVVVNVLHALEICASFRVEKSLDEAAMNIIKSLQSIKYVPPTNLTGPEFREGIAKGDSSVMYPILQWLLVNQNKVQEIAYLSKYVEKLVIPAEALADSDVQNMSRIYDRTVEDFWSLYNENVNGRKSSNAAAELHDDIKKMAQDLSNLNHRIEIQKSKLNYVSNKEGLFVSSKGYRNARVEERNLIKQGKEHIEIIKQMEFQLKSYEENLSMRDIKHPSGSNILEQLREQYRINKIVYDSQLPEELAEAKQDIIILDKIAKDLTPPQEYIERYNFNLKSDIQKLMAEKLARFSDNDDVLGPFRNQAAIISNKKQDISNTVRDLQQEIQNLENLNDEKENMLYDLVGGEVLHGDELKRYIAKLRERSTEYKRCRLLLQGFTGELGITNRTIDILKSIDPSVDQALSGETKLKVNEEIDEVSETISEARQIYKMLVNELENFKVVTSQVHSELGRTKLKTEEIADKHEEVKGIFEKATEFITNELNALKDNIRDKNEKIEHQEELWKKTTQEFEKCEYMFTRLLEDFVTKADNPEEDGYFAGLNRKLQSAKTALENSEKQLLEIEESKKHQREKIDFLKLIETLVTEKLSEL